MQRRRVYVLIEITQVKARLVGVASNGIQFPLPRRQHLTNLCQFSSHLSVAIFQVTKFMFQRRSLHLHALFRFTRGLQFAMRLALLFFQDLQVFQNYSFHKMYRLIRVFR